jgi:hypothetical protein
MHTHVLRSSASDCAVGKFAITPALRGLTQATAHACDGEGGHHTSISAASRVSMKDSVVSMQCNHAVVPSAYTHHVQTYIQTNITYIHTYRHAHMHSYIHTYMETYRHMYVYTGGAAAG